MAEFTPLKTDLPESWQIGQIVSPTGTDVGLTVQHGYNYLMKQVNAASKGVNELQPEVTRLGEQTEILRAIGDPTTSTVGLVGQLFLNSSTGTLWTCISAENGVYTWKRCDAETLGEVQSLTQEVTELEGATATLMGTASPTVYTEGKVGQFYVNTSTGQMYCCTAILGTSYTWKEIGMSSSEVETLKITFLQAAFPVGSLYLNYNNSTNPASLLGFGTWAQLTNRFLIGAGGSYSAGSTGGSTSVTLSTSNMPSHNHTISFSGGSHGHAIVFRYPAVGSNVSVSGATFTPYTKQSTTDVGSLTCGAAFQSTQYTATDGHTFTWSAAASPLEATSTAVPRNNPLVGTIAKTGSGQAFSTLNSYTAVYMWRRTA